MFTISPKITKSILQRFTFNTVSTYRCITSTGLSNNNNNRLIMTFDFDRNLKACHSRSKINYMKLKS